MTPNERDEPVAFQMRQWHGDANDPGWSEWTNTDAAGYEYHAKLPYRQVRKLYPASALAALRDENAALRERVAALELHLEVNSVKERPSEECSLCNGSGEVKAMTTHLGPDDYAYEANCAACAGTGSADPRDAISALCYWKHDGRALIEREAVLHVLEATIQQHGGEST